MVNVHVLIAVGVNAEGYRAILGIDVSTAEDEAGWLTFQRPLAARGQSGSVAAQYVRIIDALTELRKVAEHLDEACADILTLTA